VQVIHRFRDKASLEEWENSEEVHKLAEDANKYSTPYPQKALDTADLKAIVPPPKRKMAITAFIPAYLISSLAAFILLPYLGSQLLLFNLFMTMMMIIGLTYFAMPLLSRLLRRWLYPRNV
jgi:antibiotic biosynthesis monooxygenase (ABM) superfamily enzyme